jgi:very-short-patch-repair endonuclease
LSTPDFYCPSLFLAVEIDGRIHDRKNVKRNDRIRTRRLNKHGVTVIRFKNSDVFSGVQKLLDILEEVALD